MCEHHSAKGGAYKTIDPIQSVFYCHYRDLKRKLLDLEVSEVPEARHSFEQCSKWIDAHVAEYEMSQKRSGVTIPESVTDANNHNSVRDIVVCGTIPPDIVKTVKQRHQAINGPATNTEPHSQLAYLLRQSPSMFRLISSEADKLPHKDLGFNIIVVTQISNLVRSNVTKAIDAALRQQWPIASFGFIKAILTQPGVDVYPHLYDLDDTKFSQLKDISNSEIRRVTTKELYKNREEVRGITLLKRAAKKREMETQQAPPMPIAKTPSRRAVSAYMKFFNWYIGRNPDLCILSMRERHYAVKIKWDQMSESEKQKFQV